MKRASLWAHDASSESERDALERIIDRYLSPVHRDSPGAGCAAAALGADIARQPKMIRALATKRLDEGLEILAGLVPARTASRRYDAAIRLFSAMVGALILARAVRGRSAFATDLPDGGGRTER